MLCKQQHQRRHLVYDDTKYIQKYLPDGTSVCGFHCMVSRVPIQYTVTEIQDGCHCVVLSPDKPQNLIDPSP